MNGVPLPLDHGFPVRLRIPNWFGCCNIKWLNEIILVDETEPATSQMQEFAGRTMQPGTPALAKDYIPATIDQTAAPVLVEKWLHEGQIVYRIKGLMWGGYELTDKLAIQFDNGPWELVTVCPQQSTNATWTIWEHIWRPAAAGTYQITMHIDDVNVPQRRVDSGRYDRSVIIDEV
jgi:DMSO/TMAO reductase YedYZ molybdopterin-dependent catalytic subunit